jgi:hypothetical protein
VNNQSAFLIKNVLIFPIGWESAEQIHYALNSIKEIEITKIVPIKNGYIFQSPIYGIIYKIENWIIVENNKLRIMYPAVGDLLVPDGNIIDYGQWLFKINDSFLHSFIVFLRNTNPLIDIQRLHYSGFKISLKKPEIIYSIAPGFVSLDESDPTSSSKLIEIYTQINNEEFVSAYVGVSKNRITTGIRVAGGEPLGVSGVGENRNQFGFSLGKGQERDPYIIFIEVLPNRE